MGRDLPVLPADEIQDGVPHETPVSRYKPDSRNRTSPLNTELEQRQGISLKATRPRQKEVDQMMHTWQQIYAINELKSQNKFREQQNANSKAFTAMKQSHALEFDEQQRKIAHRFEVGEKGVGPLSDLAIDLQF